MNVRTRLNGGLGVAIVALWPVGLGAQSVAAVPVSGQSEPTQTTIGTVSVTAGGHARWRTESWRNFAFVDARDDVFSLLRVFGHTDWKFGNHVRLYLEGRTAHAWGRTLPGLSRTVDVDEFDIWNTFLEGRFSAAGHEVTITGGRQELEFGRQRLVSPLDWVNTRRIFDGVRATVTSRDQRWTFDGFWTRPVRVRKYAFNATNVEQTFSGVYGTYRHSSAAMDGYLLVHTIAGDTGSATPGTTRFTAGGRMATATDRPLRFEGETALQWGEARGRDIRAWMVSLGPRYTWRTTSAPWLGVGYDYATGDPDAGDDQAETFDQLFPLGHGFLGFIDLVGRQNVNVVVLQTGFWPARDTLSVAVDLHVIRLAEAADALYGAGGNAFRTGTAGETDVGQELDLTVAWRAALRATLQSGFHWFSAGRFLERTGPSESVSHVYTQLRYDF